MNLDGSSRNWQKPLERVNKQPTDSEGYKRNPSCFHVKWLVLPARWIRNIKRDEWEWFPKHWEISWAPQRSHIWWLQDTSWARWHPSLSFQVSAALLLLSCYQIQHSSAAENLVGDTFSGPDNSQTKIKCHLKTEMPKEGNPRRISTSGSCPLLLWASKVTHKRSWKGPFAPGKKKKKNFLGRLFSQHFITKSFKFIAKVK